MSSKTFFAGIDVGSSFTKTIIIDQNKQILGSNCDYSGMNLRSTAEKSLQEALPDHINVSDIRRIVTTGYGRKNVIMPNISISNITEISCSAKAANFLYPKKDLTIVDIGGQDTKIIKIRNGKRQSFKMNRKCAAGTGTFLEELALKLRIHVSDLNALAVRSSNPSNISSYCTVFAGTEILSRIREGAKAEDMIRGAFHSVVKRVMEIDTLENQVILTGGVVAKNPVIVEIFEAELGKVVSVPTFPQLFVALGAALYALEEKISK